MAINRVDYPGDLTDQTDWTEIKALMETRYLDSSAIKLEVVGGVVERGAVFQIGGVVYRVDSDETITGTASDYVRIVPNGATATAEYRPDLSGVNWDSQYNGYYDVSGNLYLFDEGSALAAGEVAVVRQKYIMQTRDGKIGGDATAERDVNAGRNVNADEDVNATLDVNASRNVNATETVNATLDVNAGRDINAARQIRQGSILVRLSNDPPLIYDSGTEFSFPSSNIYGFLVSKSNDITVKSKTITTNVASYTVPSGLYYVRIN